MRPKKRAEAVSTQAATEEKPQRRKDAEEEKIGQRQTSDKMRMCAPFLLCVFAPLRFFLRGSLS